MAPPLTGCSSAQHPSPKLSGELLTTFCSFIILLFYGLLGKVAVHLLERLACIHPSNIHQVHRCTFGGNILQPLNCHQPRRSPTPLLCTCALLASQPGKFPGHKADLTGPALAGVCSWSLFCRNTRAD